MLTEVVDSRSIILLLKSTWSHHYSTYQFTTTKYHTPLCLFYPSNFSISTYAGLLFIYVMAFRYLT